MVNENSTLDSFERYYKLLPIFYDRLITEHEFKIPEVIRTPGYAGMCISYEGVEICGVPLPHGLRIDISIPVNARPDAVYRTTSCMGKKFLSARELIFANEENLEECIRKTLEIVAVGKAVYYYNKDKLI